MTKRIVRNENAPFYFEILYAGIEFLSLLVKDPDTIKIEVKPDRLYGSIRRIEDLTKYFNDGRVEVIQIKHTLDASTKFGFADLWTVTPSKKPAKKSNRNEGKNIFKFLKSWREHSKKSKSVLLTIASNKTPTNGLTVFLKDIQKLRDKKLNWKTFHSKYLSEIQTIQSNCCEKPFTNQKELQSFLSALRFQKIPDIKALEEKLGNQLKKQGVINDESLNAFINRIHKTFVSNQVEVLPLRVLELIDRLKTGLIQEIVAPQNYIDRPDLESKIINAIEAKKKDGGFVFLFAPSGSGKTVLLSRLAEKNPDFFPYFCRIRPFEAVKGTTGYSNNNRLKSSWFKSDIIQRCHEFGLIPMSVGINDSENYIDKTFDESLQILSQKALARPDKKIVFIVDALDQVETDKYKGKSVLDAIPQINYPGIVFLLSSWGEKYLPQSMKNLEGKLKKKIGIDLYFSEKEINNYFSQSAIKLTQDQVAIIKKRTNGLAISLFYLSNRLKGQNILDEIIHSISRYSEVFDWYKPIWNSLNHYEKECLGYLCFHFASIKRADLRQIIRGLNTAAFNHVLERIEHFLDTTDGFLEPYHDSFRRFVVSKLSKDKKYYHLKLSKYYSNNVNLPYSKKYITKHLGIVGIREPLVKSMFNKLHRIDFFKKILRSNIDDRTKVEIGKSFVDYFYVTKNIENLVQYAVTSSNIYPTTYDDDVFAKARIGTEKLIAEIEDELLLPRGNQTWYKRDWVFKRLAIGNILIEKKYKACQILAHRFIDDGLFRLSLDPELLWGEEANHDFWNNAEIVAFALVNAHQYKRALTFIKTRIAFVNPSSRLDGLKGSLLSKIHLRNLKINKQKTLKAVSKSSKIDRLLFYLEMGKKGLKIPDEKDFKKLLIDVSIERCIYNDSDKPQYLDLAEALFIFDIKHQKKRILRLLNKVKIELPYCRHSYINWGYPGNPRQIFLRWISLKSLIDNTFKLNEFYSKSLKDKFSKSSDSSEYENPEFINVLSLEQELARIRLLLRAKKIGWKVFWNEFKNTLQLYKQKIEKLDEIKDDDYSNTKKSLYPYSDDILDLIKDNLSIISFRFPGKFYTALSTIENIFGAEYIFKRVDILEILIGSPVSKIPQVQEKLESYVAKALKLRQKEELGNLDKSSNLRGLAVLAASQGFNTIADNIYINSLKYSRGLWSKGDLRFTSLIDTLRTQKENQFELILKYIERVSDVVEGVWYWKLDFIESATYSNYEMALDFLYSFIVKGKSNQNDSLRRIISTYTKHYRYKTLHSILPLLSLMDITEENSSEFLENLTNVYLDLLNWSVTNKDFVMAKELSLQYFKIVKKDVEPSYRINLLEKFDTSLSVNTVFNRIRNDINKHLIQLQQEGYKPNEKTNTELKVNYEGLNIKKLQSLARRGNINAVLKTLDEYKKTNSYYTKNLVVELVPLLSNANLQRIRKWGLDNNVKLDSPELYTAIMKKAVHTNNKSILNRTQSEILRFINTSEYRYEISEMIKKLDTIDFPTKNAFMKKLLLISVRILSGSSYLTELFVYSSDSIDRHFIELKKFSFDIWKSIIEKSIRLSISK